MYSCTSSLPGISREGSPRRPSEPNDRTVRFWQVFDLLKDVHVLKIRTKIMHIVLVCCEDTLFSLYVSF